MFVFDDILIVRDMFVIKICSIILFFNLEKQLFSLFNLLVVYKIIFSEKNTNIEKLNNKQSLFSSKTRIIPSTE